MKNLSAVEASILARFVSIALILFPYSAHGQQDNVQLGTLQANADETLGGHVWVPPQWNDLRGQGTPLHQRAILPLNSTPVTEGLDFQAVAAAEGSTPPPPQHRVTTQLVRLRRAGSPQLNQTFYELTLPPPVFSQADPRTKQNHVSLPAKPRVDLSGTRGPAEPWIAYNQASTGQRGQHRNHAFGKVKTGFLIFGLAVIGTGAYLMATPTKQEEFRPGNRYWRDKRVVIGVALVGTGALYVIAVTRD